MLYLLLAFLSIISVAIGFYLEILDGNLTHLKCDREPVAGVAIMPTFPVVPAIHFGTAYGLNLLYINAGWYVIFAYLIGSILCRSLSIRKLKREFSRLNK